MQEKLEKLILTFPIFKFQAVTPPSCSGICPKTTSVEAASQITPISKRLTISGNVLLWPLCPVSQRSRPSSNFCIFSSMIKQINGILSPECELHTKTNYCFDDLFKTQLFIPIVDIFVYTEKFRSLS